MSVSLDIDNSYTPLEGNQKKLETAFQNIILNAAEAMPETDQLCIQVSLTSKFRGMSGQQPGIQIVFTDTGKGIDPEDIPNIFDPYFSSKQLGIQKGKGLGLSVAMAIITRHGGDITVDSAIGKGTTVFVYLPVSTFITDIVLEEIQALPPDKPVVMLMEDEPSLQRMCKRILEGIGFGVLSASSAREAFALFERAGQNDMVIELLIFDQAVTGDMGGAETLKELRAAGFDGKAIIVSGSPYSPEMSDYGAYGFDARILKPYTKNDITRVIGTLLKP
ncbi:MAG: response regulator [Desulfotignum sp.]|nr:response regulator [Desulfotignum sp.]MCF8090099.1 response regulator [Desulfotignum sp.]